MTDIGEPSRIAAADLIAPAELPILWPAGDERELAETPAEHRVAALRRACGHLMAQSMTVPVAGATAGLRDAVATLALMLDAEDPDHSIRDEIRARALVAAGLTAAEVERDGVGLWDVTRGRPCAEVAP